MFLVFLLGMLGLMFDENHLLYSKITYNEPVGLRDVGSGLGFFG